MLDARPSVGDDPHGTGNPTTTRGANASASLAIDDELLTLGVPPDRGFESLQFVLGQVFMGPLPDLGGFRHVGIAVKGREVLGHGVKLLDRHAVSPLSSSHTSYSRRRSQVSTISGCAAHICSISRRTRTTLLASSTATSVQRTTSPAAIGCVSFHPCARPSGRAPVVSESAAGIRRPTTV